MLEAGFWKNKTLAELNPEEWEALCDGCGWCCLYKLQDDEDSAIYYTNVTCHLLNLKSLRCTDYPNRHTRVPTCIKITPENIPTLDWLPDTCAYRRISDGCDLPEWHPLVTGDRLSVLRAGASIQGWSISEHGVDLDNLEDYLIDVDGPQE